MLLDNIDIKDEAVLVGSKKIDKEAFSNFNIQKEEKEEVEH